VVGGQVVGTLEARRAGLAPRPGSAHRRAGAHAGRIGEDGAQTRRGAARRGLERCLAVRAVLLHAVGVERERMTVQLEAALARNLVLPLFDLAVVELLDTA